ncbi:MAG: VacJ family lipoprotein [Desulfuromonadales bacterium]|jgi:phospholipid-binding lipoprotein MlaA|nr:VacJ family lipoprotein [Desulfuromonadales bacterium]
MRILPFLFFCLSLWVLPQQIIAAESPSRSSSGGPVVKDDFDAAFDDDFADDFGENSAAENEPLISDPLEGWNRGMFWVNDKLYFYALKPVARGFRLVPRPARKSIGNFFSNLATPARAANALLQMKFRDTGTELGRFLVNSTIGWGGLFDPAGYSLGWKKKSEDFGQTLGYYGVGSGWYLFLPLLGPSSVRDGVGMVADQFLDPTRYVRMKEWEYYSLKGLEPINRLSLDPDTYEGIKRDALDPYLFIRAAYAQHRLANIDK